MESMTKDLCEKQVRIIDERFTRDLTRIDKLEQGQARLTELSIQMGEILKHQTAQLDACGDRLCRLEQRPAALVDAARNAAIAACISLMITVLFRLVT